MINASYDVFLRSESVSMWLTVLKKKERKHGVFVQHHLYYA